jgi:mannose-6-phosphate isomerase-like protein (cupin superfamily)
VKPYEVVHVDELARIPVEEGLLWRPLRRRFGIRAFGTNAYTSERVGGHVVEEHKEGSGHEELYLVLRGRARFTLDGEAVEAPAGTIVFLPEGDVLRVAIAEEEGTLVLAVGGWPDKPFEPSAWEWFFEAYSQSPEEGVRTIEDGLRERPDHPALLYHLACLEARAGRRDDAIAHLRRAIELRPELEDQARGDDDVKELL